MAKPTLKGQMGASGGEGKRHYRRFARRAQVPIVVGAELRFINCSQHL
jgi:hypothetical protein